MYGEDFGRDAFARIKSSHVDKAGRRRDYQSVYLRRSFREGPKVKHDQLANLSRCPKRRSPRSRRCWPVPRWWVPPRRSVSNRRCRTARRGGGRDGAHAGPAGPVGSAGPIPGPGVCVDRVAGAGPGLEVVHPKRVGRYHPGRRPGGVGGSTDEIYAAMDWLHARQDDIEKQLAARHLGPASNPSRIAMFDLSSSWVTGRCCELAARGYSRDGKKGCEQIEYGLLTDPEGRPIAVRVFPGNTADPTAFTDAVAAVKDTFKLANMVMVGDRGMITSARIDALRELGGIGWLTALRAPAIAALAADTGPLQMTLFDDHDFAEITHPRYPGERLICCRNPLFAVERARKRGELLAATEQLLAPIAAAVAAGRLVGADQIGLKIGAVADKYKMKKHLHITITDTSSPSPASTTKSTPRPPSTASTCCARACLPPTWTPPR